MGDPCCMNEVVREWLEKAEGDSLTAERELAVTDRPNYDAVCFHAQQCIEKLMKAVLISRDKLPPRSHDLVFLGELLKSIVSEWSWPLPDLRLLDRAAVGFRYPGESADFDEARQAFAIASALREKLLEIVEV